MPTWTAAEIRELRERLGLTQEQMAARVGVSFTTISRWERGHRPPSPMAAAALARIDRRGPVPK